MSVHGFLDSVVHYMCGVGSGFDGVGLGGNGSGGVNGLFDGMAQVGRFGIARDCDGRLFRRYDDFESGVDAVVPSPVDVEGTDERKELGIREEVVPAGGRRLAVGGSASWAGGCAPPVVCFVAYVSPAVFKESFEGVNVGNLGVKVAGDGAGQGRVHFEFAYG